MKSLLSFEDQEVGHKNLDFSGSLENSEDLAKLGIFPPISVWPASSFVSCLESRTHGALTFGGFLEPAAADSLTWSLPT